MTIDLQARHRARQFVARVLRDCGVPQALSGSWKHGDFHLSPDGISFSDVDLMCQGLTDRQAERLGEQIRAMLSERFVMRVSVHSRPSLGRMSLEDSRFFLGLEYATSVLRDSATPDYLRSKVALFANRQHMAERYQSVSHRLGLEAATRALEVKLGTGNNFSIPSGLQLVGVLDDARARDLLSELFTRRPTEAWGEAYLRELRRAAPTIDTWLKDYAEAKFRAALG